MKKILICTDGGVVQNVFIPGLEHDDPNYEIFDEEDLRSDGVDFEDRERLYDEMFYRIAEENKDTAPPSHWEDDPDHPVEDWRYEVGNNDTRLGYREWIQHRKEIESHEQTQ